MSARVVRRRRLRTWPIALMALVAPLLLASCSEKNTDGDQLRAILRHTAAQARHFSYTDISGLGEQAVRIEVTGRIEDDFRYAAELAVNNTPVYEERVRDDAIAARVSDDRALTLLSRQSRTDQAAAGTQLSGGGSSTTTTTKNTALTRTAQAANAVGRQALVQHQWTLDRLGAPTLIATGQNKQAVGDDPILDALTMFRYVQTAADQAWGVQKFNPDRLDYRANRDPFPHPDRSAGEIRYDLERPWLTRVKQAGAHGEGNTPTIANFRMMSVYVKHGVVERVLEKIEVATLLDDIADVYDVHVPKGLPQAERDALAIQGINVLKKAKGEEPIRIRSMAFAVTDVGAETSVELPTQAVVGSLVALRNRGSATGGLPTTEPSPVAAARVAVASGQ